MSPPPLPLTFHFALVLRALLQNACLRVLQFGYSPVQTEGLPARFDFLLKLAKRGRVRGKFTPQAVALQPIVQLPRARLLSRPNGAKDVDRRRMVLLSQGLALVPNLPNPRDSKQMAEKKKKKPSA